MAEDLPALGIDVGGGSAKIGIVSRAGEVLAEGAVPRDPCLCATELLDRYLAVADMLKGDAGVTGIAGIGIGLPGHIDFIAGAFPSSRSSRPSTARPGRSADATAR